MTNFDSPAFEIRVDDLTGEKIIALLKEHLYWMDYHSPPASCYALDLEGLRSPEVTVWSVWDGDELAGCGALKEIDPQHGEVKSMRTAETHLRRGVASLVLGHLIQESQRRGYQRVSLETGAMDYFIPAQKLYARFGFESCGPFGSYGEDPDSLFMTREV